MQRGPLLTLCHAIFLFAHRTCLGYDEAFWQPIYDYYHIDLGYSGGHHGGPQIKVPEPRDVMVDVINDLGVKLLAIHNEHNENNIGISPYGALSMLAALTEGVQGNAAKEIIYAAHIPKDKQIVRVGLRDIHRHLKSYFIPQEGFLAGLTLNLNNVTLRNDYADILRFYGFDYESFNNALYPGPSTTAVPPEGNATLGTTLGMPEITTEESQTTSKPISTENKLGFPMDTTTATDRISTSTIETTLKEDRTTPATTFSTTYSTTMMETTRENMDTTTGAPTTFTTTIPLSTTILINNAQSTTNPSTIAGTEDITITTFITAESPSSKTPEISTTTGLTTPATTTVQTIPTTTTIQPILTTTTIPPIPTTTTVQPITTTTTVLPLPTTTTAQPTQTTIQPKTESIGTTSSAQDITTQTSELTTKYEIATTLAPITTTELSTTINSITSTIPITTTISATTKSSPSTIQTSLIPETTTTILNIEKGTTDVIRTTKEITTEIITNDQVTAVPPSTTRMPNIETSEGTTSEMVPITISETTTESTMVTQESISTTNVPENVPETTPSDVFQQLQDFETTTPFFFGTTPQFQDMNTFGNNFDFNYNYDSNSQFNNNGTATQGGSLYDDSSYPLPLDDQTNMGFNANARRSRSVTDYILQRFHGHHINNYNKRPFRPYYIPQEPLTFMVYGKHHESGINFMKYDTVLPFFFAANLNTLALSFPLDNSKYYLLLLLPIDYNGVDQLICDLRLHGNFKFILENLRLTNVIATIPSFTLKGYVTLTPSLQQLGVRRIFEPRQADFSPMTNATDIYVTNIEQAITVTIQNYLDPAAAQNYKNFRRHPPVYFKADHPFLYFVMDAELNVALMVGKLVNPLNSRIR